MTQQPVVLDPLDQFYTRAGLPLLTVTPLQGASVPEPYRSLLVHERDMTPTVERLYQQRTHLRVLSAEDDGKTLLREVVLALERDERPVVFGAIRIHLRHLAPAACQSVLSARIPLGRVLEEHRIAHVSRPAFYFKTLADATIRGALNLTEPQIVYGRRNRLLTPSGQAVAEVVEILPP
ncbi:MAG: hypothetical protein AB1898_22975 [Acidobacteriota bacterium]